MTPTDLGSALLLGLAGAGHCLGMCGGMAVVFQSTQERATVLALGYHGGRLLGYTTLGAVLGGVAGAVTLAPWTLGLRFFAGLLLIAVGLHTLNIWSGIRRLEQFGDRLWRIVVPLTQRFLPPRHLNQAVALGLLWGFMPCGLIYSALAWSGAAGAGASESALLMLFFGIGTLPAMLGATLLGQSTRRFLGFRSVRTALGTLLLAAGLWTLWQTSSHLDHLLQPDAHSAKAHNAEAEADDSHIDPEPVQGPSSASGDHFHR